jgi:hypothetical protein
VTLGVRLPPAAPIAALAAAAVFAGSAGDVFVAVALLVVALGVRGGAAALGAATAAVARWGTPDLGAIAGDQAVLGAAVTVGPGVAAASSAFAGLALLLVARPIDLAEAGASGRGGALRRRPDGWLHEARSLVGPLAVLIGALPCGLGAAALVAGPATTSAADLGVRVGASIVGVVLAVVVADRRPDDALFDGAAVAAGATALGLAVVA